MKMLENALTSIQGKFSKQLENPFVIIACGVIILISWILEERNKKDVVDSSSNGLIKEVDKTADTSKAANKN